MMHAMVGHSYLFGGNAPFIEELYERYLQDPATVEVYWRDYFDRLTQVPSQAPRDIPHWPIQESFIQLAKRSPAASGAKNTLAEWESMQKQVGVLKLILAYRILGVRYANLDPLKRIDRPVMPELDLAYHGLSEADLLLSFNVGPLVAPERLPLADIITRLQTIYCGNIGLEYMHLTHTEEKHWLQRRFEGELCRPRFDAEQKKRILKQITAAETLERYLHTKYVGQKRFSLEGGESVIAALDQLIHHAGKEGAQELIIGMAHRGRLNVLVNTLGKSPRDLFAEFEGKTMYDLASGDVKYHMGFSSDVPTAYGPMHISLAFNPSHLEIVNPVVEGSVRARQEHRADHRRCQVVPVLIHGDAALAGLGVNQGTFNLSQTRSYGTGGTIHLVINNQVGFTTSDVRDVRSTLYCTDVAKMIEAPIFHVNGDDPEAVCYVTQVALDYRMRFKKDVVVDIVCYRKLGHNEGDDPFVTQPMMYKKVAQHQGVRALYAERLVAEGVLEALGADALISAYRDALDKGEHVEQTALTNYRREHANDWTAFIGTQWTHPADTTLPLADIQRLAQALTTVPAGFALHPTVEKVLVARRAMAAGEQDVDWGMAETLAYASLVTNGYPVRLSGEDSGRGTFAHRHAVLHDQNREHWNQGAYIPLCHLSDNQAQCAVIDSILNEEAVLAYEYGYACASPNDLVMWEAQFGDFANTAQVAIDQFISSGETKWGRLNGLTVILPHGYDGQGPEHSSARLERWLQLSAECNIQVVMLSEAAQMFHVLRRQILRPYRKPLVIFLSKRLLRYKDAMSPIEHFTGGGFCPVIGDVQAAESKKIKRVVLCSGQVYYDLFHSRKDWQLEKSVALIRIEQLYPFPIEALTTALAPFSSVKNIVWAQEEPRNQGAWYQIRHRLEARLNAKQTLSFAGRPSSASPAVGYMSKHLAQLKALIEEALLGRSRLIRDQESEDGDQKRSTLTRDVLSDI